MEPRGIKFKKIRSELNSATLKTYKSTLIFASPLTRFSVTMRGHLLKPLAHVSSCQVVDTGPFEIEEVGFLTLMVAKKSNDLLNLFN